MVASNPVIVDRAMPPAFRWFLNVVGLGEIGQQTRVPSREKHGHIHAFHYRGEKPGRVPYHATEQVDALVVAVASQQRQTLQQHRVAPRRGPA